MRKKGAKSRRLERQDEETEEEEMVSKHAREPPELIDDVDNGATPPSAIRTLAIKVTTVLFT
jgi:hypothetical protein